MEINTWDNAEYLGTFTLLNQQRPVGINDQSGSVHPHILKAFNILGSVHIRIISLHIRSM